MPRHVHFQEDKHQSIELHPLLQYDLKVVLWFVQQKEIRPWLRSLIHSTTSRRRTQDISLLLWFVFITMLPDFGFPYFWICCGNLLAVVILQFVAQSPRPLDLHPSLWQMQQRCNIDDTKGFPCVDCHMAVVVLVPAMLHSQSMVIQLLFVFLGLYIGLCKLVLASRFVSQVLASFILGFTGIILGNRGKLIVKSYKLTQGYTIAAILALLVLVMLVLGTWIENNESSLLAIPKQDFLEVITNILHSDATSATPSTFALKQPPVIARHEHNCNEDEKIARKRDSFYYLVQGMRTMNQKS